MKYLIVVAHPDDEVLGAGASISRWTQNGDIVDVAIMCAEAKARAFRPDDNELEDDTNASTKYLGVDRIFEATFPNIEMNTVPHLRLVQFIESAIKESEPDIVITDVHMPVMDGITLARKIHDLNHHIKIIFLSGYDDFSYVQSALQRSYPFVPT